MNKKDLLLKRLDEIGNHLKQTEGALALLALGSCGAQTNRLDDYSDLDFFVICEPGYKQKFLQSLDWLSNVHPLVYAFKNSDDGYKAMYADNIFCELAIFEPHELKNINDMTGRFVWHAENFDPKLCEFTPLPNHPVDINHSINEALTNLYVGLGRYHRGERYSAYHFICVFAAIHVTNLITTLEEPTSASSDPFAPSRRFEARYPKYEALLANIMSDYENTPKAAQYILNFLDEHFTINEFLKERILELCEKAE